MDFMKVLDQTVREIKREVNLKVLKVPEIEQKVLDATSDEPWGPHGSALSEIAQATKKFTECEMIMNVLWTRVGDTSANWRHIYKALAVIEYLIANGSERAVDDIMEHSHQIVSLSGFEYVEPSGKDVGINVRKKVETILALIGDKEKIQAVRNKASATRDKYFGLSSTGITYKSSSASYGTLSGSREGDSFRDSYKDSEQSHLSNDGHHKSHESFSKEKEGSRLKKGALHSARPRNHKDVNSQSDLLKLESSLTASGKPLCTRGPPSSASLNSETVKNEDEFDDFDPRSTSTKVESTNKRAPQVDLFGESLVGDLLETPTPVTKETSILNETPEADLFADAAFVSAVPQTNVDLFAEQPALPATTGNLDLFAAAESGLPSETKYPTSNPTNISSFDPFAASDSIFSSVLNVPNAKPINSSSTFDPFAAIPGSNIDGSDDLFGAFASNTELASGELSKDFSNNLNNLEQPSATAGKPAPKKDPFKIKSGIWADSLSRGLIDLNITAPKKTNLADIGIVGGLGDESDEKERVPPLTYMGRSMGAGSGLGRAGISSSTTRGGSGSFSSFLQ